MLADNLYRARTEARLSKRKLAQMSGVNVATIADIEKQRNRRPSYDTVVRLARALGTSPDDLFPVEDGAIAC